MNVEPVNVEDEQLKKQRTALIDRANKCLADDKLDETTRNNLVKEIEGANSQRIQGLVGVIANIERSITLAERKKFDSIADDPNVVTNEDRSLKRKIVDPSPTPEAVPEIFVESELPEELNLSDNSIDPKEEALVAYEEYLNSVLYQPSLIIPEVTDKFEELELPSRGLFYSNKKVMGKPMGFRNMRKLSMLLKNPHPSILMEAVSPCISMDLNLLTQGDFVYFMYWLRSKSLPRTPMTVNWISRYGTKERLSVSLSKLKENRIRLTNSTLEIFNKLKPYGVTMPKVFDMTLSAKFSLDYDIDEVEQWTFDQVQYFNTEIGETVNGRIERVSDLLDDNLDVLTDLALFKETFEHGVEEVVTVQADPENFKPKEVINHLREQAARFILRAEAMLEQTGSDGDFYREADDYAKEADHIENMLKKGERVIPRKEDVVVNIDPLSFFSGI